MNTKNIFLQIAILIIVLNLIYPIKAFADSPEKWGMWQKWGEQEKGFYYNPILPADFSDIDCIRVDNKYFAITSTFQFSPGMAILSSKDLVNWDIIGHAVYDIRQISPEMNWDKMNRYNRGIWAGSIRYNNGKFYVLFGTPDEGFFTTSAQRPEGPWSPLINILPESGWDDCSAIWDDNGKAYFVGTLFRDRRYETYLFKMSPDCSSIDRSSAILLHKGDGREANKLIKVDTHYYLIYSMVERGARFVVAKRAENILGPWSEEKRLTAYNRDVNEPNQGGIVEGPDGKWYFLTHHGTGDWEGRAASLLPVIWKNGWPLIGNIGEDSLGYMVWKGEKPLKKSYKKKNKFYDNFTSKKLKNSWEWNYYPNNKMWSLTERRGYLRMKAVMPLEKNNLKKTPNILTQRVYRTSYNRATVKMNVENMANGQTAGLCHYARTSAYVGICSIDQEKSIVINKNGKTLKEYIGDVKNIWFRSEWGLDGISQFSYSLNGKEFTKIGEPYHFTWGDYRGTRIGLFTSNEIEEKGFIDIDFFEYIK